MNYLSAYNYDVLHTSNNVMNQVYCDELNWHIQQHIRQSVNQECKKPNTCYGLAGAKFTTLVFVGTT